MSRPPSPPQESVSRVRARRQELGLTQEQVADLANVPLPTFRQWDRGAKQPRNAGRAAQVAQALDTSVEDLWGDLSTRPPAADPAPTPHVPAPADQARPGLEDPTPGVPGVTDIQSYLETVDNASRPKVRLPRPAKPARPARRSSARAPRAPRLRVPKLAAPKLTLPNLSAPARQRSIPRKAVVAAAATMLGAGVVAAAIATASGEDPATTTARAIAPAPTAAELQRRRDVQAMNAAAARGDYDGAIRLAGTAGDTAAAARWRTAAATLMVKRARQAAERGDLPLAKSRLARAQDRYDTAPGRPAVEKRIDAIERARADRKRAAARKRAAERKRIAARRAAARRRAAASSAPATSTPNTGSSSSSATPELSTATPTPTPKPTPTPTPKPTPAPSGGGSSRGGGSGGSSGDGSGGGTVDPGLF